MEVYQIGVNTRAGAALNMTDSNKRSSKKRKVIRSDLKLSPSYIELPNGRRVLIYPDNSVIDRSLSGGASSTVYLCPSECSSCCSIEFLDLQDEDDGEARTWTHDCYIRSITESGKLESTIKPHKAESGRSLAREKMRTESELEEFFVTAERDLLKVFNEKYNFNFANEKPLEGRYEWIDEQQKLGEEDNIRTK